MTTVTLTSKGQTTIPKKVRKFLRLSPGDKLDFVIEGEGRVLLRPATIDVLDLRGLLKRKGARRATIEQMKEATIKSALKGIR